MKKFKFSLEKVLAYRKQVEEQLKTELINKREEHRALVEELDHLRAKYSELKRGLGEGRIEAWRLAHWSERSLFLEELIDKQAEMVEQSFSRLRALQKKYIEARRSSMVLEKLKEKKFAQYEYEVSREMQKGLDEFASSSYVRRS
ncbi:MAG TPA: flagellar export protein FliJ [Peptococcaceae bacterium]|nr:MAG: Flagellar export protein FliJ [Clostridia bacterium 41_269]HBT20170.1 flagellar export protein FliJ [Peptococcaceae bacterium]